MKSEKKAGGRQIDGQKLMFSRRVPFTSGFDGVTGSYDKTGSEN